MGFSGWLGLLYLLLIAFTVFSFAKGRRIAGIVLLTIMIVSALILFYLWLVSPM